MKNQTCPYLILGVIRHSTIISQSFFSMLEPIQIVSLMLLSSQTHDLIKQNVGLMNRLFYGKRLQIEKSMYFDFQIDGIDAEQHLKDILERITVDTLNFVLEVKTFKLLEDELVRNLKQCLKEEEAYDHLENLRSFMIEPELPMPGLQKQNVGQYCNTPIQMFITKEAIQDNIEPFEEEICNLRKQVIEHHEDILSYFALNENHDLIKKIRYNPELFCQYLSGNCHYINILQLLILYVRVYVNSMKKILQCCQQTWSEQKIFTEFCLRYSVFRNTICSLQYGFIFKHFNETFSQQFKDYPSMPNFSFWRVALKIWNNIMCDFHCKNKQVFVSLLITDIKSLTQQVILEYVSNPQSPNNTECEFRKSENILNENDQCMTKQQMQNLFTTYQEYLIDISANCFNIHWCGSTEQRLAQPYIQAQKQMIKNLNQYLSQIQKTFTSPLIAKKITTQALNILVDKIKPCTYIKVQDQFNLCLENIKQKIMQSSQNQSFKDIVSSWKKQKVNTTKSDSWIKHLAEERGLKQQSGQKYKTYFNTSQIIDLQQLQKQVRRLSLSTQKQEQQSIRSQQLTSKYQQLKNIKQI